ncbi:hypothetical protein [Streptomonospora litoralis]|uniref:Uncharacterized protein n=1 Tax=Streptomonospora litoralis TaxID=2498135 RepID=A0A4P6Q8L4_9ACTN|nr:hypothetical protein [Streptomonospora litoralis]QBI56820.1 hypothetical protein EKD16_25400 [Streptomonospora litoralis]
MASTTPLLGRVDPGHRQVCAYANRGCTCYLLPGQHGRKAAKLRRRRQRAAEKRTWRRDL